MKDLFGIIAIFDTPDAVKNAALHLRQTGFRSFDAYTPYPIEGLSEIIHPGPKPFLPLLMFAGAVLGAAWGYWIQYWGEALNYPINVGGRPYNSWPAFIVSAFEFMLLFAIAAGFFGLLTSSRLSKLYHPIFEANNFSRASCDGFLICIESTDPHFDAASIRAAFERLGAQGVEEVHA